MPLDPTDYPDHPPRIMLPWIWLAMIAAAIIVIFFILGQDEGIRKQDEAMRQELLCAQHPGYYFCKQKEK